MTKGARHKIALSIQKLRERQSVLKALENVINQLINQWSGLVCVPEPSGYRRSCCWFQDILEGGNVRNALQELQQIVITPIKVYAPPTAARKEVEPVDKAANPMEEKESEGFQTHNPPACDGESPSAPISDGDITGQFTRVMGKGTYARTLTHTCTHTHTHTTHTHTQYSRTHTHYTHMHTHTHTLHTHAHSLTHAHTILAHTHRTLTHIRPHTHSHFHSLTRTHYSRAHTHTHTTHAHSLTYIHSHARTLSLIHSHTLAHSRLRTFTLPHTLTRTHTQNIIWI